MKKSIKRLMSMLLAITLLFSSSLCVFAVDYPAGVTQQMCDESAVKTDLLVSNAMEALGEKTLKETVREMLCKDETLSSLLTGIYGALNDSASVLKLLGIDITPKALSQCLSAYASVSQKLAQSDDWNSVDLTDVKWGVSSNEAFADAAGAIFAPFNNVLYMILCGGTYRYGIIFIPGDHGYEKGLISMLKALGCTYIEPGSVFENQAASNKNKMMSLIVSSLLSSVEAILDEPAEKLCEVVPNLADYIKNGGLEESVNALLKPLTLHIGDYIQFFTGSQMVSFLMFIQNPDKYTMEFSENITTVMNDMLESVEFQLPEIDLDALISCKGDRGGAYRLIMTWLLDTVKLNLDKVKELLPQQEEPDEMMNTVMDIAEKLLAKESDELFTLLVGLFTAKEGKKLEYQWSAHQFTKTEAVYDEGMGVEDTTKMLEGIDGVLNDLIVEMMGGEPLKKTIKGMIYSNDIITSLVKGLYGLLSGDDIKDIAQFLSLPTSPYQLSLYITDFTLGSARKTLAAASSFDEIESIDWNFKNGSAKGFKTALTAALRPLRPFIEAFLANGTIEIFDSVNIGGSNGYNTAIIPLLEAFGCSDKKIKTYSEYEAAKGTDKIITYLLDPLTDLINTVAERPVYTLTAILPNVLFFVDNGSLMQCLDNLIYPLTTLLSDLSIDLKSFGLDLDEIKNMNIIDLLVGLLPKLVDGFAPGLNIGNPDVRKLEGMGELQQVSSKRSYNGNLVTAEYVKADQSGVFITLFRYIVELMTLEENSGFLGSLLGGDSGSTPGGAGSTGTGDSNTGSAETGETVTDAMGNIVETENQGTEGTASSDETTQGSSGGTFDQFSAGIGDQLAGMTPDEVIAWIYKLFFRERPVVETTVEEYTATIIYVQKEKEKPSKIPVAIGVMILIAAAAFVFARKDSISDWYSYKKEAKNDKKLKISGKED